MLQAIAEMTVQDVTDIFVGCILLVAVLVVGFFLVAKIRHWSQAPDLPSSGGFTLGDLRQLHRSGQMSTEEFEKAKSLIVDGLRLKPENKTPPPKPDPPS